MRNNGILNIDVARADLPMQPEYWIEETYVSRYEKLLRVIERRPLFCHIATQRSSGKFPLRFQHPPRWSK